MRIGIVVVLMTALSFTSFAQKRGQKAIEKDSVVFFYASIELNNGLNVLTSIDSISTSSKDMAKSIFQVNAVNRLRILKFAQTTLKDRSLMIKDKKQVMVLMGKSSLMELKSDIDRFISINKGTIFNLENYKFIKPSSLGEDGPRSKVTVH